VEEHATRAPLTLHLSNLNMSEDMEDREPPAEEEEEEEDDDEFIVLDSEHVCCNIYYITIYEMNRCVSNTDF